MGAWRRTAVDSHFQAHAVDLRRKAGDSIGELGRVGDDALRVGVAVVFDGPAVVDCWG